MLNRRSSVTVQRTVGLMLPIGYISPLSMFAGSDKSLSLKRRKAMLPLPLPPNPLNPFGVVSGTIAVTATVAGLGVGLALGAAMIAAGSMMSRHR